MKARPFLAVVLAVAIVLASLGFGGWWIVLRQSPLKLQNQLLAVPMAARFVPRLTPLSLYWLTDPEQPVVYGRAVAPTAQRHQAAATVARLRDGAFAAAGIDYQAELASWLGPETSLALINGGSSEAPQGWLLALRSRHGDGARRFLQRFWQVRSLAGTDVQVSTYRGMGLISGRGALVGSTPMPLATALINDDLVLIASGQGVLQQALDVSQIDGLNQATTASFQAGVKRLAQGSALLTARPEAMAPWLGLPKDLIDQAGVKDLLATLRPERGTLVADVVVGLGEGNLPWRPLPDTSRTAALLAALHGQKSSLALLQNPAGWPAPWQPLLQAILVETSSPDSTSAEPTSPEPTSPSPIPALVALADAGPLLWSEGAEGWQIGTGLNQPAPEALDGALPGQGLVTAPLAVEGGPPLQVWTRLKSPASAREPLQASLEGARSAEGTIAWWGQTLAVLQQQRDLRQGPQQRQNQLTELAMPKAPLQWAMAGPKAQGLIQGWGTWRLLSGLAGQPLAASVDGLTLGLEPETNGLHFKARLSFA
ncbi:DUF3352 domain-containing protein [Cyanobium sp. HWJ4-Hawea]|uniref:DUF3352 domain-containing protein n=1 Tax=Cyanobium sp. HWJ4-Hawea TaxID=2823713 RepID=UPI0020CC60F9|nr:DUF3352 domain-containing protein [Cyanobium sp. HWJ4-Hawea]MCP9808554.1 DUF3352 domain-containing protein [Cyanobium sp. HWJ4-Hawea]